MNAVIALHHPGAVVRDVTLLERDDGTNRRARFGVSYAAGSGPATVFAKAESDVAGRRQIHARNGNLFNEPLLFQSGAELPLEHPLAYTAIVDEPNLDYAIVFEDLLTRGADPRHAMRPFTPDEVANGLRGLARLHSRHWNRVASNPALAWVQPFTPTEGWREPLRALVSVGIKRAGRAVPDAIRTLTGRELVDRIWVDYVRGLTVGPQTLLHGDPHIGNTYLLPDGEVGFLDWQVVRSGNWSHDVGYFLQSSLTEDDRRRHEGDLLEGYRDALEVSVTERPSREEAWLRYRASAVHGLTLWLVTLPSDAHAHERSLALVRRYAAAYTELDTPAAIDEISRRAAAQA